jgi:hypothetical protein
VLIGAFKTALCRAYRICSTSDLLVKEIQLLMDIWEDNGFKKEELLKIKNLYRPPPTDRDIEEEVAANPEVILAPNVPIISTTMGAAAAVAAAAAKMTTNKPKATASNLKAAAAATAEITTTT